jgi:hypothetical protein
MKWGTRNDTLQREFKPNPKTMVTVLGGELKAKLCFQWQEILITFYLLNIDLYPPPIFYAGILLQVHFVHSNHMCSLVVLC